MVTPPQETSRDGGVEKERPQTEGPWLGPGPQTGPGPPLVKPGEVEDVGVRRDLEVVPQGPVGPPATEGGLVVGRGGAPDDGGGTLDRETPTTDVSVGEVRQVVGVPVATEGVSVA